MYIKIKRKEAHEFAGDQCGEGYMRRVGGKEWGMMQLYFKIYFEKMYE